MTWFSALKPVDSSMAQPIKKGVEDYLNRMITDNARDTFIEDIKPLKRANLKRALEEFMKDKDKYPLSKVPGFEERVVETIDMLEEMETTSAKYEPSMKAAIEDLNSGKVDKMLGLLTKEVNRQNTDFIKSLVKKNKNKILNGLKELNDTDREKLSAILQEKYGFAAPSEPKYLMRGSGLSAENLNKYIRYVVFGNVPRKYRKDLLPELGGVFGSDYTKLPRALDYILKEPELKYDTSVFETPPVKESIAKIKALRLLRDNQQDSEYSNLQTKMAKVQKYYASKENVKNKGNKIDLRFLKSLNTDEKRQFAIMISKLDVRPYTLPKEDYDKLDKLDNTMAMEYGFEHGKEFEKWLEEDSEREAAWDAMLKQWKIGGEKAEVVMPATTTHKGLLSRLFGTPDKDIKQTLLELYSAGPNKTTETLDTTHRQFKDILIVLDDLDEEEKSEFSKLWTRFKRRNSRDDKSELLEQIMYELVNNHHYAKIRKNMRKEINDSIRHLVDTNYSIKEKGVIEPLAKLQSLGALQVIT
tara:strand:+ start:309 stop:1892 length:1584 start_codon:yes stop_codon:yes gene_type:complete